MQKVVRLIALGGPTTLFLAITGVTQAMVDTILTVHIKDPFLLSKRAVQDFSFYLNYLFP